MKQAGSEKISSRPAIMWDLDNTLYRFEPYHIDAFHNAMARAVVEYGIPLTHDEAMAVSRESFRETSYSGHFFIQRYQLRDEDLHHRFHAHLDVAMIERNPRLPGLFSGAAADHAVVTHGSGHWARQVLSHLGILEFFQAKRIVALEDAGFRRKHESESFFATALENLDRAPADNVIVVEDTLKNLRIPHAMGLTTVLITHGEPPAHVPDFIRHVCNDVADVLQLAQKQISAS